MMGDLEEGILAETVLADAPGDSVEEADSGAEEILEVLAEVIEGLLRCMMLFVINVEKNAKFLSSQAGTSRFTAATALEKAKILILNQEAMTNIKKSLT